MSCFFISCHNKLNIKIPEIYYVTRSYSTRHGAGPFDEQKLKLKNNEEETNVTNEWQKWFRTAPIDYSKLNYAINLDQQIYSSYAKHNLVVTCIDQIEENSFRHDLIDIMFEDVYESHSPYSKDFKKIS